MKFQHQTNTILKHILCRFLCLKLFGGITKVRRWDTETCRVVSHLGTLKQASRECLGTQKFLLT